MADDRLFVEEGRHSTLGASSAYRWLACPGSIALAAKLALAGHLLNKTNPAAAEGTAAHTVLAACLEDGSDAHELKGTHMVVAGYEFVVDDEMVEGVQATLDFVREKTQEYKDWGCDVKVYVEKGLSSIFDPDAYGTSDIIIHVVGERMLVIDFKYGRGVTVEPTSEQNAYYGYLSVENYVGFGEDIKVVESWIAQPRIPHPQGIFRRHVTNVKELTDWWMNTVLPGMEATRKEGADLVIGDHCRFCPAKSHCPALKGEAFNFSADIDPSHLTNSELGELLEKAGVIRRYLEGLESEAFKRSMRGDQVPGYKLVRKKANRVWKEGAEYVLKRLFGDDAYTDPKLKTPPQLEKIEGGKEIVSEWAYKPDSGLTLAPISDKRDAVRSLMDLAEEQGTVPT
jgi:hypothetical protein